MIEKDFRALLPAWLACAAGLVICTSKQRILIDLGIPIYFFGAATLGSLVVGHEYSHRTLASLLAQPVSRARVWRSKLGLLLVMLLALSLLAAFTVAPAWTDGWLRLAFYGVPILSALFIAPWLTMLARSPLAGAVSTLTPPGLLFAAGQWVGIRRYGYTPEAGAFRDAVFFWGLLAVWFAGAVLGWRAFSRLEVREGRGVDVDLTFGRKRAATSRVTRGAATWQLVKKELHLHQPAYAVAAMYIVMYVAVVLAKRGQPIAGQIAMIVTFLYSMLVAPLVGAMACAEERCLGTHDSQLLLPISSARQWAVKTAAAAAVMLTLAVLVPVATVWLLPANPGQGNIFALRRIVHDTPLLWAVAFAMVSLFISSLAGSGMRALMLSIPAVFALIWFVLGAALPLAYEVLFLLYHPGGGKRWPAPVVDKDLAMMVLFCAVGGLVLRFALTNYRAADRSIIRVGMQVAWTAIAIIAWAAIAGALAVI